MEDFPGRIQYSLPPAPLASAEILAAWTFTAR
jgi:hypothetical protein